MMNRSWTMNSFFFDALCICFQCFFFFLWSVEPEHNSLRAETFCIKLFLTAYILQNVDFEMV